MYVWHFKNTFKTITSLPDIHFRFRRFIWLVQMKKVFSVTNVSSTKAAENLILLMRDLYFNFNLKTLTDFINISRRAEFKDILPWNISQMQCCKLKFVIYNYCSYSSFYWPFFCGDTQFNICFDFENLW